MHFLAVYWIEYFNLYYKIFLNQIAREPDLFYHPATIGFLSECNHTKFEELQKVFAFLF